MAVNSATGTLLKLSIASVYTTIAQRTKVKPADSKRNKIETTDLDSTAETSIPGIPRNGEVELELNWDNNLSTHAQLTTSYNAGTTELWQLVYKNVAGTTDSFSGWISDLGPQEATVDGLQKCMIKIQVTGVVTRV